MKILLLGRDGQVGRALQTALPTLGDVVALGRREADLERPADLAAIIARERPRIVVNAAAYTAVDAAEDDRARAFTVNADAVEAIGDAAAKIGALVVHYSTDCVFDGTAPGFQRETERPNPVSVYGESKLAGELALAASGAAHLIFRISWIYAPEGRNFPLSILRLARERDTLDVVTDEIGAPTSASLVASVTAEAIGSARADPSKRGIFHLAAAGLTSRSELACFVVAEAAAAGAKLRLTPDAIRAIPAADYKSRARRPLNSRLDTTRLRSAFDVTLPPWQEGVRQLISTLNQEGRL